MKTTRTSVLLAGAFLLLAPVANAQEKGFLHPAFFSIMRGAYGPEDTAVKLSLPFGFIEPHLLAGAGLARGGLTPERATRLARELDEICARAERSSLEIPVEARPGARMA